MSESDHYYGYWGKAGEGDRFHLLPYHSLDVAACGLVLLESHDPLGACLSARLGLDAAQLVAWLSFFLALQISASSVMAFKG